MTPQQVADIATAAIAYRIAEKKAFWASLSIEAEERVILRDACLAAKHTLYAALDKAMADLTNSVQTCSECGAILTYVNFCQDCRERLIGDYKGQGWVH